MTTLPAFKPAARRRWIGGTSWRSAAALLVLSGCQLQPLSGPPTLHLGRDECAECGMLIIEDRSSCALLIEEDGHRAHLLFDDIGCLIDYRADHGQTAIVDAFIHDHNSRTWGPAASATYLICDALSTPMGSGIVAFHAAAAAAELHRTCGGSLSDYDGLAAARQAWESARRAPDAEAR